MRVINPDLKLIIIIIKIKGVIGLIVNIEKTGLLSENMEGLFQEVHKKAFVWVSLKIEVLIMFREPVFA